MPIGWIIRVLGSMILFRALSRRFQGQLGTARSRRSPMALPKLDLRNLAGDAGIAFHLVAAAALGVAVLVGGVVTTTLLVLGPRWLGVVVGVGTLLAAAGLFVEVRRSIRAAKMRYWRIRHVVLSSGDETTEAR